ncbi:hypothetical protein E2C01_014863 [Portunus trituberculatus]|uniref:Uncharacterized protein n=1 Tax=Portunus trituberculatus TaxID=210409 RepID=A0A5B7DK65_PORTR|nr:hypothetical protein [Portunus trituberculatus]
MACGPPQRTQDKVGEPDDNFEVGSGTSSPRSFLTLMPADARHLSSPLKKTHLMTLTPQLT